MARNGARISAAGSLLAPRRRSSLPRSRTNPAITARKLSSPRASKHLGRARVVAGRQADEVPVHRRFEQCVGLAIVEHTEAGLDPGLDREPPQQRLGEGVDSLDVDPARRLEYPREQPPGQRHLRLIRVLTGEAEQRLAELFIAERDPSFERFADPVGHLRSGGLGKGQREDLAGLHPLRAAGPASGWSAPGSFQSRRRPPPMPSPADRPRGAGPRSPCGSPLAGRGRRSPDPRAGLTGWRGQSLPTLRPSHSSCRARWM